jgi:hypothetical protein
MDALVFIVVIAFALVVFLLVEAALWVIRQRREGKNGVSHAVSHLTSWEGPRCHRCGGASSFDSGPLGTLCYVCRYEEGRLS